MSRHRKRNQRKIDVTFEEKILGVDLEQRGPAATKTDSQLFFVDSAPSESSKKEKWRNKKLHADLALQAGKPDAQSLNPKVLRKVYSTSLASKSTTANKRSRGTSLGKRFGGYDLWGEGARTTKRRFEDPTDGWLEPAQPTLVKAVPKWSPTEIAAVEAPKDSESYRPTAESYNAAAHAEVAAASKMVRAEERVETNLRGMKIKALTSRSLARVQQSEAIAAEEAAAEVGADEVVERQRKTDGDGDAIPEKPTKAPKPTKGAKRRHVEEQLSQLQHIAKEVDGIVEKKEREVAKRAKRKAEAEAETKKRLGPHRFIAEPTPVMAADELPDGLRTIPNVAHPVRERYAQFQKRNLIEARVKAPKRRERAMRQVERGTARAISSSSNPVTTISSL